MKTVSIIAAVSLLSALILFAISPTTAETTPENAKVIESKHIIKSLINASSQTGEMPATQHIDSIILGAGCFWGAEKRYQAIPGVIDAISGYAGGQNVKANYSEITSRENRFNENNHAEVVKVIFNRSEVSLESILKNYFEGHDPTQLNRQGNDVGTQYRSTILTNTPEQKQIALKIASQYQPLLSAAGLGKIVTKIDPLIKFFPAEEYHQDYLVKNPNGYCPIHATGVKFNQSDVANNVANNMTIKMVDNKHLMTGKQIVIIDSEDYCPYCEKFKKDVLNDYQGTIPVTFRFASQLKGLTITTETWATPTILFLQDGSEVFGQQGYMKPETFYKALGAFKLGQSESFKVAFDEGTDSRYCQQYEIFKNTPDGVFIDKLSGAPLFDTQDRFDSGSGWLSFTKSVDGSVIEKQDNRFGMSRVEIRSKTSGIHLGHVFPDGPNGKPRYCINATVLEFKPRNES